MTDLASFRHTLLTPLNHIIGYTEILMEDAGAPELTVARSELKAIHTAAYQVLQLIQRSRSPGQDAPRAEFEPLPAEAVLLLKKIGDHASTVRDVFRFGGSDIRRIVDAADCLARLLEKPSMAAPLPDLFSNGNGTPVCAARLLVVDDDENNRDMLKRLLEPAGYEIETACSGEHGLGMLRSAKFEVILLDIVMPGMNGFDVLSALKADQELRQTAVIVISALDEMESVSRCIEMGADDFVAKPFDRVILQSRISAVIKRGIAERERAQLADWFRLLLEATGEGIFGINRNGECTFINGAATKMLERSREELIGQTIHDVVHDSRTNGANYPADACPMNRAATYGEASRTVDEVFWRTQDESFPVEYSSNPIFHDGELQGAVITFSDVSERKRTEAKFRETAKLESIGVLAGGVAHDFNNLLTGILGNASFVLDSPGLSGADRERLEYVIQSSERAADLTKQLLAYASKGRYEIRSVDLPQLIQETMNLIQTLISRSVRLDLQLDHSVHSVDADPTQIQQVILSLVINAGEAIGELRTGAVLIRVFEQVLDQEAANRIGGKDFAAGTYVVLEVSDTGLGMSPEVQGRIFDPLYTTKFAGRSLGLAAVMGIVKSHQGAIHVTSSVGQGSRFEIYLPPAKNSQRRKAETDKAENRRNGRILVVDDEDIILRTTEAILARGGYGTVLASDGEEAVSLLQKDAKSISAVLLDVMMPGMSGDETFRKLRMIRPDIPIIISSGYNEVHVMQYFEGSQVSAFIQKPYSSVQLVEKIDSIVNKKIPDRAFARGE
jgi:PAS domain S-box-containing protein